MLSGYPLTIDKSANVNVLKRDLEIGAARADRAKGYIEAGPHSQVEPGSFGDE
jgi:hypothetical protein